MARADVLVVGAGPAGAIAARECARAGLRTVLVDQRTFPRDKVCGDALIPDSQALLAELGLDDAVRRVAHACSAVRVIAPGGRDVRLEVPFLTVRRETFDALLVEEATRVGATLETGRVVSPKRDAEGAVAGVVDDAGRTLEARLVVLATGAASGPLEAFGMRTRSTPSAFALRCYVRAPALPEDALVIDFERGVVPGYGWIFPMGNGEANLGVGVFIDEGQDKENLRAVYDRFLRGCPAVRPLLEGVEPLGEPRGAPLRCALEGARSHAAGLLVAGEALGTTYSLSGEGIGKAMDSGRIAARVAGEALAAGRTDEAMLAAYPRALEAARYPEKFSQYRAAQRFMRRAGLVDLLAWRAQRSAGLRTTVERVLREEAAATDAMSLRGIVRSLWN